MLEPEIPSLHPPLPSDINELCEGLSFVVKAGSPSIVLIHDRTLTLTGYGPFGTLGDNKNGNIVTKDSYLPKPFIPKPETILRVVVPASTVRDDLGNQQEDGIYVTIGRFDSNEVYRLIYVSKEDEENPRPQCPISGVPACSLVRTLPHTYVTELNPQGAQGVVSIIAENLQCLVWSLEDGSPTIIVVDGENPFYYGKNYKVLQDAIVEIHKLPDGAELKDSSGTESQIWAQVREVDNSKKTRSNLRDSFRTLAERLLRYLQ